MNDRRVTQLDVLRTIAVVLVICRHSRMPDLMDASLTTMLFRPLYYFGWSGVDLFFVLSGFLVSGLLFREYIAREEIRVGRFLVRRGLKIYPAFYVLIAITFLIILYVRQFQPSLLKLSWPGNPPLKVFLSEALFVQNYFHGFWGHTWSLAIEEHFYLGIGLLLWAMSQVRRENPFHWMPAVFVTVGIATLALRWFTFPSLGYSTLYRSHLRIDGLLFGVLLSYLTHFHYSKLQSFVGTNSRAISIASLALITPGFFVSPGEDRLMASFGLTAMYLGFGGLLLVALRVESPTAWLSKLSSPIANIGAYSYSIYLWHMAVRRGLYFFVFDRMQYPIPYIATVLINAVVSIAFGILMAKLVELPVLRLRERFFPSLVANSAQAARASAAG